MTVNAPGRYCPLSYRYEPAVFRRAPEIEAETLYVVGGLYGNRFALDALLAVAAREPVAPTIVFNGDFNWFDAAPADFAELNARVLEHCALRGNVETELASDDTSAGCGCGYPEWVSDAEVARSNAIEERLRATARTLPALRARLGALPMHAVARVGGVRIGIVHGDAWSLAGWEFSQERLSASPSEVAEAFEAADVRIFASSHTCLPVLQPFEVAGGRCLIANNGAAGMPNFRGERYGLITRIAVHPCADAVYGACVGALHVDALPIRYDHEAFLAWFDAAWPAGSPAAVSYRARITEGPRHALADALRGAMRRAA
jgi:hypothetical protein